MKIIKNSLLLILIISMLLSVSCSDGKATDPSGSECTVIPNGVASFSAEYLYDDFKVQVNKIDLYADVPYIDLTVFNETDDMMSCDPWYIIERNIDGTWTSCAFKEAEYNSREPGVLPRSSASVNYSFGEFFDVIETGEYRLRTNIYLDATGAREKSEYVIEFKITSDDIYVTVDEYQFNTEAAYIDLTWHNESPHTVYLGEKYRVEKFINDEWVNCATKEVAFDDVIFAILPDGTADRTYTLSDNYDIGSHGRYRISIEYYINADAGAETREATIEITVPFVLEIEY